ncbi:MAG: dynamin family protein [Planctomycetes bacterium]|nr:dynamin family protein [Planctomycetota bacterium]
MANTPEALLQKYDDLSRIAGSLSELGAALQASRSYREPFPWEQWREKLDAQLEQLRERRFRLAFAGGFSVGKSYLVSAFLGRAGLLPSYNKPTTGVCCGIRKGTRRVLEVSYWSRTESDEMQRFYLNELGVPRSVPIAEGPAAVEAMKAQIPVEKRRVIDDYTFLRRAHEKYAHKLGTTHEVEITEVRPEHRAAPSVKDYPWLNYILKVDPTEGEPNQDLLRAIKQVIIHVDSPYLSDTVEILDLPGAGASDPLDGFIQRYFLHKSDGAVVTTRATDPFGEQEQAVIDILRENRGSLAGRVFVTVTMFDRLAGPELEPERLDKEYRALRRRLREDAGLGDDTPFFYVSPFITALAERERTGEKLTENDQKSLAAARAWPAPRTGVADLDRLLGTYKNDGGLPDVRDLLLKSFRSSMVRLKVQQIARGLQHLTHQLEAAYKKRWEAAQRDSAREGARRITAAIKYLHASRDGFTKRSQRFRREVVQKQPFDDAFKQVLDRITQRIQLFMQRCSEDRLRQEFDGLGGGRDPVELLNRFREATEAALLEEFSELIWDRAPRPTFSMTPDDDLDDGLPEAEPDHHPVPPLAPDLRGALRRHIRDGYYAAIGKDELHTLVQNLLPNNPDERVFFQRVFDELDLALEITTRNFVTREALELNDSTEFDDLAKGSSEFPDWARRYGKDYGQAFQKRLERYCRNLKGYLWNLYFKHLEEAEGRLGGFLGSDDLLGLVTVHIDDIELPNAGGALGSPAQLLEHMEKWKTVDAAITTLEREVAG